VILEPESSPPPPPPTPRFRKIATGRPGILQYLIEPGAKGTAWLGVNVSGRVYYGVGHGKSVKAWWVRIGYAPWQWGSIKKVGTLTGGGSLKVPSGPKAELRLQNDGDTDVTVFITDDVDLARTLSGSF